MPKDFSVKFPPSKSLHIHSYFEYLIKQRYFKNENVFIIKYGLFDYHITYNQDCASIILDS